MYTVSKCAPQEALRNLDAAFKNFFRRCTLKKQGKWQGKLGYPRFRTVTRIPPTTASFLNFRCTIFLRLRTANGKDDVARLPLRLDVPRRLDHVLQWVVAIDDRPVLPGLDELLEQEDVCLRVARW